MTRIDEVHAKWLKNPKYQAEYDALEDEFALAAALIDARTKSALTQEQIAERMGTSRTAVVRLLGGTANPSVKTLQRYAHATGTKLRITFEPDASSGPE